MSVEPAPRTGRFGGIFVAVVVGGSAIGVVGWYLLQNRGGGAAIDKSGFDLAAVEHHEVAVSYDAPSAPQQSGLSMLKNDPGVKIVDPGSGNASNAAPPSGAPGSSPPGGDKKEQAHASFTQEARKHEGEVRRFAEKMTRKYPIIAQYGRDWMSHPDLKKLNDDYMRNHDPIAFMVGLSKAPSLGAMIQKYGARPEMRDFVVEGVKQAPGELMGSAVDVLQNDGVVKNLIANVAGGLGLPPSVTSLISGGADPAKIDKDKVMGDIMKDPNMAKAMQQSGQQAPPVNLSGH